MKIFTGITLLSAVELVGEFAQARLLDESQGSLRLLKAATRQSHFLQQDGIHRKFSVDMSYAEGEIPASSSSFITDVKTEGNPDSLAIFAGHIRGESDHAILHIEEFEHHLSAVKCRENGARIVLEFQNQQSFQMAKKACRDLLHGIAITSHAGCNNDGERQPYK